MMEKIPMVIPNKERNVRNLLAVNECQANRKLSKRRAPISKKQEFYWRDLTKSFKPVVNFLKV
jgi:hypothetical protein